MAAGPTTWEVDQIVIEDGKYELRMGSNAYWGYAAEERINSIVSDALESAQSDEVVWASGGDGGHVAFFSPDWQIKAVEFICKLRQWAEESQAPLRITGHFGAVDAITGADGRVQLVGDGINFAGRILEQGFADGVLVSADFKAQIEQANLENACFGGSRILTLKYFSAQELCLFSVPEHFESSWAERKPKFDYHPSHGGDADFWDMVYQAKRAFQFNSRDEDAVAIIQRLRNSEWSYPRRFQDGSGERTILEQNPILAPMNVNSRLELIRLGQLIEQQPNDVLCEYGDEGDTMFLVLRGKIGIVLGKDSKRRNQVSITPKLTIGPGEIVGELAYILRRPRTATLVSLSNTAILSFNYAQVEALTNQNPRYGRIVKARMDDFMTERVLGHVCNHVAYLIGEDSLGPLGPLGDQACSVLIDETRILSFSKGTGPISLADARFGESGLYVLVRGRLRSKVNETKTLDGKTFPIVFVDFSEFVVSPDHSYFVEDDDTLIMHISMRAFFDLDSDIFRRVVAGIKRQLAKQFHYDAFLSYTFADQEITDYWKAKMEAAGLRVYMQVAHAGHRFPERIAAGILDSLALVVLVSAHTMSTEMEKNWVRKEIDFRETAFDGDDAARIYPIALKGGRVDIVADGHSCIEAFGDQEAAVNEVIEAIRNVRNGEEEPAFALTRKTDLKLGV
ncbi:MAG: cyclic nucleotide-binding domain-containing protein [Planctomycetes bacterium]|nr:cyclic nucleotide-binding domain-containing protein [Planctomycetota bacterium]